MWFVYWLNPYLRRGLGLLLQRNRIASRSRVSVGRTGRHAATRSRRGSARRRRPREPDRSGRIRAELVSTVHRCAHGRQPHVHATVSACSADGVRSDGDGQPRRAVRQYFARMGLASRWCRSDLSDEGFCGVHRRRRGRAGLPGADVVLAPAVGGLFHAPQVMPVLRGLGVSFVLHGLVDDRSRPAAARAALPCTVDHHGRFRCGRLSRIGGRVLLGAGGAWWRPPSPTTVQAVWQFAVLRHPVRPVPHWRPYRTVCSYGTRPSVAHVLDLTDQSSTFMRANRSTGCLGSTAGPITSCSSRWATTCPSPWPMWRSRPSVDSSRIPTGCAGILQLTSLGHCWFSRLRGMAVAAPELVAVRARTTVGGGGRAGAVVRARRGMPRRVPAFAVLGRGAGRAEPLVVVQVGYLLALAALILLALPFSVARRMGDRRSGGGGGASARISATLCWLGGYSRLSAARMSQAHFPALFASLGVALAIAAARWILPGAPSFALLATEIMVGALALALCIRVCPTPAIRAELQFRLAATRLLGPPRSRRRRAASLVLGPSDRAVAEGPR